MSGYSLQRCVIHPLHSKVGVCSLCLRERLLALEEEEKEEDRSNSVSSAEESRHGFTNHDSTSTAAAHSAASTALETNPAESMKEMDANVVPFDRPQQRLADEWIPENCTIPPPPLPTFLHRLKLKTLTIPPPSPDRPPTATAMAMASSQDAAHGIFHHKFNPSRFSNFVTPRRSNASELADHVNNVRLNCGIAAKQTQKSPGIHQKQDVVLSHVDLLQQQKPASECSLPDQVSSSPLHPRSNLNSTATSSNWITSLFSRGSKKNKQSSSSSSSSASSKKKTRNRGDFSEFHGNEGPIVACRMSVDGSFGLRPSCPPNHRYTTIKPKPHWADNETPPRGSSYSVKSKCDPCTCAAANAPPSASLGERLSTARLTFKVEQRKLVEPNPDSTWARSDGHVDVEIRRPAALFERSRSCGSNVYTNTEFPNSSPSSKNAAARPKRSCPPAHVSIPKHAVTGVGARNGKDSRLSLGSYFSSPFRKSAAAGTANRKQAAVHHL